MSNPDLLYEIKGHTAWITLNREARRNALSLEMIDLFYERLDRAEGDANVRVICITGAGEKAFCSGADLAASLGGEETLAGARKYAGLLKKLATLGKPLVAKVNGHCMAGGMGLLLSCDMAYARDEAKFGTPEVNVGLFPMMIAALIFRNASRKKALEMIYTARMLTAAEAEEIGLITRALPREAFDRVVDQTLETVASKAPLAIGLGRRAMAHVDAFSLPEALDFLCEQLSVVAKTEDAIEGLTAFLQKRKPDWKGR
ncbi:MAG: enoyl-CoA hydratase [Deltaproteobacteria bacterium]|nr:enoyl-CoA hydratase [Deltaproteobacteria bacterium]